MVLWTCTGVDVGHTERKGYYLQFAKPQPLDINSTDLRRDLIQTHSLNEETLSRLSTQALVKLFGRILEA